MLPMDLNVIIEQDEDGGYVVPFHRFPGVYPKEKSEEEAKKNIAEAIELHLSVLARDGMPIGHRKGIKETFVAVDI